MRRVKKAFAALAGIAAFCWLIRITPPIVHAVNFWTPVNSPLLDDYLPVTPSVTLADTSALNWRFATQPLGATYHIYARLNCTTNTNSGSYACGIYLYDGTKVEGLEALWSQTGGRPGLRVETMTNVSTDAATLVGPTNGIVGAGLTLSIIDDGVHRTFYYWMTGAFHQLYQEPTGTFLTPTSAGFGGATAGNNAGSVMGIQCLIWSVAP